MWGPAALPIAPLQGSGRRVAIVARRRPRPLAWAFKSRPFGAPRTASQIPRAGRGGKSSPRRGAHGSGRRRPGLAVFAVVHVRPRGLGFPLGPGHNTRSPTRAGTLDRLTPWLLSSEKGRGL